MRGIDELALGVRRGMETSAEVPRRRRVASVPGYLSGGCRVRGPLSLPCHGTEGLAGSPPFLDFAFWTPRRELKSPLPLTDFNPHPCLPALPRRVVQIVLRLPKPSAQACTGRDFKTFFDWIGPLRLRDLIDWPQNAWVDLDDKILPCTGGYMDLGENAVQADDLPFTEVPDIGILWAEEWAELLRTALQEAGRQLPDFRLSAPSCFGKEILEDLFGKVAGGSPASVLLAAAEDFGGMEFAGSSLRSTGGSSAAGSGVSPKTKRLMSSFHCFNPASQMCGKAAALALVKGVNPVAADPTTGALLPEPELHGVSRKMHDFCVLRFLVLLKPDQASKLLGPCTLQVELLSFQQTLVMECLKEVLDLSETDASRLALHDEFLALFVRLQRLEFASTNAIRFFSLAADVLDQPALDVCKATRGLLEIPFTLVTLPTSARDSIRQALLLSFFVRLPTGQGKVFSVLGNTLLNPLSVASLPPGDTFASAYRRDNPESAPTLENRLKVDQGFMTMFESTRKSILQSSGATIPDLTSFKVGGFFYDRFLERGKGLVSMFASAKLAEEDDLVSFLEIDPATLVQAAQDMPVTPLPSPKRRRL